MPYELYLDAQVEKTKRKQKMQKEEKSPLFPYYGLKTQKYKEIEKRDFFSFTDSQDRRRIGYKTVLMREEKP